MAEHMEYPNPSPNYHARFPRRKPATRRAFVPRGTDGCFTGGLENLIVITAGERTEARSRRDGVWRRRARQDHFGNAGAKRPRTRSGWSHRTEGADYACATRASTMVDGHRPSPALDFTRREFARRTRG